MFLIALFGCLYCDAFCSHPGVGDWDIEANHVNYLSLKETEKYPEGPKQLGVNCV